jgi:lysophospholipid acyltransferase (LPLAT)-like uncharacterized protein
VVKPGAVLAAVRARGVLVPMGAAMAWGRVLGSWDRFMLPWPFSRIVVVLGAPIEPGVSADVGYRASELLAGKIVQANQEAEAILAGRRQDMVPFSEAWDFRRGSAEAESD